MHFRNDNLKQPRIKQWSQLEYDHSVTQGFLDRRTTLLRDGSLFSVSASGVEIPRRWTKAEYNEKVELGFLCKQRVFLYRGELIEMRVMSYLHAWCCQKIDKLLFDNFRSDEFQICTRCPIEVPGESMPEPDAALVSPLHSKHFPHPNGAALIIEVSEESSQMERERAYDCAAAFVPDYWIVNGCARTIDVFRDPVGDSSSSTGYRYASHRVTGESESLSALAKSGLVMKVSDFVHSDT